MTPRERHAVISASSATPMPVGKRTERLSLRGAAFWIGALSLAAWAAIIKLVLSLF